MNETLTKRLIKKFKFLKKKSLPNGFEFEDGWYQIFHDLCKTIDKCNPPDDFVVTKAFEKHGRLHVYTVFGNIKTRSAISDFEEAFYETCDRCGNNKNLEQCDKCTVPVIDYSSSDEDDQDQSESTCQGNCSSSSCTC